MTIDKVIIRSFGSHLNSEIPFLKDHAIIVGDLNSGKSTILQAIEFAFTGQCERFRKKTSDFSLLAHTGKSRFEVEVWTTFGVVKRGRTSDAQYLYWQQTAGSPAEVESAMFHDLKTTKDQLLAVMTGDFLDLDADSQREMILRLMGVHIDMDAIKQMFVDDGAGDQEAFDYFKELYTADVTSIQHFNQAYKTVFNERTNVNRALKEAKPIKPPDGKRPDVDAIKFKLEKYDISLKDKIATAARLKAMDRSGELESITREARKLEAWFNSNSKPTLEDSKALLAKQKELYDKHEANKASYAALQREDIEAETEVRVHTQNVALLEKFNGICVAGTHQCPADMSLMRQAAKDSNVGLVAAKDKKASISQRLKVARTAAEDDFAISDIKKRVEGFRKREEAFEEKKREQAELEKRLTAAKSASYETDSGKKIKEAEEAVKDLEGKISYGKDVLEKAQQWVAQERLSAGSEAGRAKLEVQSRHLEALCAFFGPDGSKKKLVESKVAGFQEAINEHLKPLGFTIGFSHDPWRVNITPDPLDRPVDRSSRSERWRLNVAIQLAISKLTDLGFVIIDNAELLTPEVRFSLLQTLKSAEVQGIVALTLMKSLNEFMPPKDPAFEWFGVRNLAGVSTVEKIGGAKSA